MKEKNKAGSIEAKGNEGYKKYSFLRLLVTVIQESFTRPGHVTHLTISKNGKGYLLSKETDKK